MEVKPIILLCLVVCVRGFDKKSTIVKRSGFHDQAVSGSGYSYQSTGNGPISYSTYTIGSGNPQNLGQFEGPQHLKPYGLPPLPLQNQLYPVRLDNFPLNTQQGWRPTIYSLPSNNNGVYGGGFGGGSNHHKYEKGSGSAFDEARLAAGGARGEKGHKSHREHDDKSEGKHLNEGRKEHFAKGGGREAASEDSAGYNSKASEAAHGAQGGSHSNSERHRKGSKTTGFHKVYHKDEYKKDHSFYDESDSSGHHDEYEKKDSHYGKEKGQFEKGAHANAAREQSEYGSKGFKDEGRYLDADKGSNSQKNDAAFYENQEKYEKNKGQHQQDENGYAVSDDE